MIDTSLLIFFVAGKPAPGGSKRGIPYRRKDTGRIGVNLVDSGKRNAEWRSIVAHKAAKVMDGEALFDGPLQVSFQFYLSRPLHHYRTKNRQPDFSRLKDNAPVWHAQKPDILKLIRSTEDALSGVVWVDDCQTVDIRGRKWWVGPLAQTGVLIEVSRPS